MPVDHDKIDDLGEQMHDHLTKAENEAVRWEDHEVDIDLVAEQLHKAAECFHKMNVEAFGENYAGPDVRLSPSEARAEITDADGDFDPDAWWSLRDGMVNRKNERHANLF